MVREQQQNQQIGRNWYTEMYKSVQIPYISSEGLQRS